VLPPPGAKFYPFYALATDQYRGGQVEEDDCALLFGNFQGSGIKNFGKDAQYGAPNLYWFFGQNSGGPRRNPCIPQSDNRGE
jgi:hypothetical protein